MILSNIHTHTLYCDGKNSAEEMVLSAIKEGCSAIGFSGHSYLPFATDWVMSIDDTKKYVEEINCLKNKYAAQIEIFCGVELDYFSEIDTSVFDYVIGSVHFVKCGEHYIPVDETPELLYRDVKECFNGDFYKLCEAYYEHIADIKNKTNCDVVGHFDLITKFNENNEMFDESDERYKKCALSALESLKNSGVIIELNTGAISRGWRTSPYPSGFVLDEISKSKIPLIITSDSHSVDTITYWFDNALSLVKEHKIQKLYKLTKNGFESFEI